MTHVYLAEEGHFLLDFPRCRVGAQCCVDLRSDNGENILYGTCAECSLAEHIFVAGKGMQLDNADAGTFLPTVVLFLHEQVKFVEGIGICAVLFLIVFERFE